MATLRDKQIRDTYKSVIKTIDNSEITGSVELSDGDGNGTGVSLDNAGNISATGDITANSFSGDGSELTGINVGVTSVNTQTGDVVIDSDDIQEGSVNLWYSDSRVSANADVTANTAKRSYPEEDETKLSGISAGAEVNPLSTDELSEGSTNLYYTDARVSANADVVANTAKTGITTEQANAIVANTAKVGITAQQASDIQTNNAKVGITTEQADAITANTAKVGITTEQANAIVANTAKVGITTEQANAIVANTAKNSYPSADATKLAGIEAGAQVNPTNVSELNNDSNYATQSYVDTSVSSLVDAAPSTLDTLNELAAALGDDPNYATTIATQIGDLQDEVDLNTAKNSYPAADATKLAGIEAGAEVNPTSTDELSEGTSNLYYTDARVSANSSVVANTAKVGITSQQAADIVANNAKISFDSASSTKLAGIEAGAEVNPNNTDELSEGTTNLYYTDARVSANSDVAANTAKVGITSQQAADIITNNAKVGITTAQADAIVANTAKNSYPSADATKLAGIEAGAEVNPTSTDELTEGSTNLYYTEARVSANADVAANTAKVGITAQQAADITTNNAKISFDSASSNKLAGIEAGAEVNPTASEIKTSYESNANTNAFTDAEKSKLSGIESGAQVNPTNVSELVNDAGYLTSETDSQTLSFSAGTLSISNGNSVSIPDTNTQLSDEEVQDKVAAFISGSGATTVTYDDVANTLTISSTDTNTQLSDSDIAAFGYIKTDTNTQRTDEEIQDVVGAFISGSGATTVTYNDSTNSLLISSTDTNTQRTDAEIDARIALNPEGFISDYTVTQADVTAHQAALSITESQISDLSHFSGNYNDLTNKPTTITAQQASDIIANNAKVGITTAQADAIVANTAKNSYPSADATKVGHISVTQAVDLDTLESDVATNNAKVGITTQQASDITANNAKISFDTASSTKLAGIESGAEVNPTSTDELTEGTTNLYYTDARVEANSAVAANTAKVGITTQQAADITTNNAKISFDSASSTKLAGIEANATADQTASEIRALVESATDSNVFTDADHTKLDGIEAGADVTDTANVVASLTAGTNITIDANGTISSTDTDTVYTHPTHPGDDFSVDTGALTGATVVSDIDINVTTDTLGHVTDANGSVSTRTLTLADLGYTGDTNANNYVHPTHAGDDINLDTGALTGATVISDLDFNVTTDTLGHVTDANATYSTRNLTASDVGAAPSSHNHDDRYYTESESDARFVNVTGDTMTGDLTLNNSGSGNLFGYDQYHYIKLRDGGANWITLGDYGGIRFFTGNNSTTLTEKVQIAPNGNVGIGTASPDAKLEINGDASIRATNKLYFGQSTTALGSWTTRTYANGSEHRFNAQSFIFNNEGYGSTEYLRITSSGNVGIGNTNPTSKLDVAGDVDATEYLISGDAGMQRQSTHWAFGDNYSSALGVRLVTDGQDRLSISTNGNVGIGTTSPNEKLQVNGNIKFSLDSNKLLGASYGRLEFDSTGAFTLGDPDYDYSGTFIRSNQNNYSIEFESDTLTLMRMYYGAIEIPSYIRHLGDTNTRFGFPSSDRFLIQTAGSTRFFIDPSGNIGIGTTTPSYQLQLSQNSAAKPTSSSWTVVSDERVKTNIRPYESGLEELLQVEPKVFDYNGKAGFDAEVKDNIGVIAQEIKDVMPETVKTYKAKLNEGDKEDTELYNFDSHALTFALINSVKELNAKIEELQNEIQILKSNG